MNHMNKKHKSAMNQSAKYVCLFKVKDESDAAL